VNKKVVMRNQREAIDGWGALCWLSWTV